MLTVLLSVLEKLRKHTYIYYCYKYIYTHTHIILQILSRQSHQLFLYAIIFKLLSMMYFRYSQIRSEIVFSTHNMKAPFMIKEN